MIYLVIAATAFCASLLTFFSGFGLGTLLLPVFAFFFPVETAIALTGVVHFLNGVFKLSLVGKEVDWAVLWRFGAPAAAAALLGAWVLGYVAVLPVWVEYELGGQTWYVTPVKVAVGALLAIFAILEWLPVGKQMQISRRWLPLGGCLSGFFGGLTGHQGALRSAFLIQAGLSKTAFVATGAAIAAVIDISRLGVYARRMAGISLEDQLGLLAVAVVSAFAGAYLGARLLQKTTLRWLQRVVALMLMAMGVALVAGWV